MLDIVEDGDEHLVLGHAKCWRVRVIVSTVVYDAIHVEVQAIEFRDTVFCDELRDRGIPLAHPTAAHMLALIATRGLHQRTNKNLGTPIAITVTVNESCWRGCAS